MAEVSLEENLVHPANEYLQYYSRKDAFFDVEEREKRDGG
jgi:hypothetical protein